jgi:hypothetical protein
LAVCIEKRIESTPNSDTVATLRDPSRSGGWTRLGRCPVKKCRRNVMAKGQMRSTKEKKKPKAEWNKKKKGGPAPSPFALGQSQNKTDPYAKKG